MLIFGSSFYDAFLDPMLVTFDGPNKLIIENPPATSINTLDVSIDIYSCWKRWVLQRDNAKYAPALRVIGGDEIKDPVYVSGTYFLINGWRIRPAEVNHTLNIVGNLFVDGGGVAIISTLGNYAVNSNLNTSSIVSTVLSGSGVTTQDKTDIISGVWNENITNHLATDTTGKKLNDASTGALDYNAISSAVWGEDISAYNTLNTAAKTLKNIPADVQTILADDFATISVDMTPVTTALASIQGDVDNLTNIVLQDIANSQVAFTDIINALIVSENNTKAILGLVQHNFNFTNQIYDVNHNLLAGNIKIYDNKIDCQNDVNPFAIYNVNAQYNVEGELISYKVTEV